MGIIFLLLLHLPFDRLSAEGRGRERTKNPLHLRAEDGEQITRVQTSIFSLLFYLSFPLDAQMSNGRRNEFLLLSDRFCIIEWKSSRNN